MQAMIFTLPHLPVPNAGLLKTRDICLVRGRQCTI